MAQINQFLIYLLQVEGRKTDDMDDPASKCYPGGIHTNMGITFCKFKNVRSKIGKSQSHRDFLNMSLNDYKDIVTFDYFDSDYFKGFWKTYETRPVVTLFLIDWAFNHGNGGMENAVAKYQREIMKINDNNITIPEILTNFRLSSWSDKALLTSLFYRRIKNYEDIASANPRLKKYLNGWKNRVKRFYLQFAPADVLQALRSQGVSFSGL